MKIAIVDDEKKARKTLQILLGRVGVKPTVLKEANSVESGVELLKSHAFDVVFLDVEMLDGTAFDLLHQVKNYNFNLIFTTAYDQYALEAFKQNAIDYLLKPINIDELSNAIEKVGMNQEGSSIQQSILELTEMVKKSHEKIAIKSANSIDFVEKSEIIHCKSDASYTTIFLANGNRIVSTQPLKRYEEILAGEDFFRVNKSDLVNLNHIQSFKKDHLHGLIIMDNGSEIRISRRKKTEFKAMLERRMS